MARLRRCLGCRKLLGERHFFSTAPICATCASELERAGIALFFAERETAKAA